MSWRFACCFSLLLSGRVWAEVAPVPDADGGLLRMSFALVAVLSMLVGSLWLLKRLAAPRDPGSGLLRVVAGVSVGARERVVLLEVGGATWLVLGVAQGQVSALAEIPRQEISSATEPHAPAQGFNAWLKHFGNRDHAPR